MALPPPDPQLLEALYVRVSADATDFTKGVNQINSALDALESRLMTFSSNLAKNGGGALADFGRAMSGIGGVLTGMAATNPQQLARMTPAIEKFVVALRGMSDASMTKGMLDLGTTLNRVGGFLTKMEKVTFDQAKFDAMGTSLTGLFGKLGGIQNTDKMVEIARLVGRMGTGMANFSKVDPNAVVNVAHSVNRAIGILSSTVVGPNAHLALATIAKMNTVAKGASFGAFRGGGAGGRPPGRATPPRAPGRESPIDSTTDAFGRMQKRAVDVAAALGNVRLAMIGMSGGLFVGIQAMNAFDDAMIRALAHIGDFDQELRLTLSRDLMAMSGTSRTSTTELTKSFDLLASSGMSAGMAMKALRIAEDFALAGGMKTLEGTHKLIDAQRNLGLNSEEVAKHYANMTKLSDTFVGIAPQVGATAEQMADAFSGRFPAMMQAANLSLTDAVALIGALSQQGTKFRGAAGGDFASRLLGVMTTNDVANRQQWKNLLKGDISEDGQFMPIADIADRVTAALGNMGGTRRVAQLKMMGFEQQHVPTILQLIGMGPQLRKLSAEVENFGGISEKTAEMLRHSFSGQMTALYNNAVNLATVFAERLAPILFVFTDAINGAFRWFTKLNPAFQQLIVLGVAFTGVYYSGVMSLLMMFASLALSPFRMLIGLMSSAVSLAFSLGGAFVSLAAAVPGAFRAVYSVVSGVFGFVGKAFSTISWLVEGLLEDLRVLWKVTMEVAKVALFHLGSALLSVALLLPGIMADLTDFARTTTKLLFNLAVQGVSVLAMGFVSLVAGLAPLLIAFATMVLMAPLLVVGLGAVAAAAGSLFVTLGIGLVQFAGMIGGAVAAVWMAFTATVASAFTWVSAKFDTLREQATGVWQAFKGNAMNVLVDVGNALSKIAGFFWNFRENIRIVGAWWSENWREALKDIGNFIDGFVTSLAGNFVRVFYALGSIIYMAIGGVFNALGKTWRYLNILISHQWDNLWADAGNLFRTFMSNLIKNFMTLMPVFVALADYIVSRFLEGLLMLPAGFKEQSEAKDKRAIYRELEKFEGGKDLVGPFEGAGAFKTKGFDSFLKHEPAAFMQTVAKAGGPIADMFGGMLDDLAPLFGTKMSGVWKVLYDQIEKAGGFKLPGFQEMTEKFFGPTKMPSTLGDAGQPFGKGGPGYAFKQMSAERYEFGGALAERLDYQQLVVLKSMDKNLAVLATAAGKGVPAAPLPGPMIRAGE